MLIRLLHLPIDQLAQVADGSLQSMYMHVENYALGLDLNSRTQAYK